MNGFVLDDRCVLDGMTGGSETGVIGGRRLSGGGISFAGSKMLKSEEAFQTMWQWTYENIQNAAAQIAEGYYPIAPVSLRGSAAVQILQHETDLRKLCRFLKRLSTIFENVPK